MNHLVKIVECFILPTIYYLQTQPSTIFKVLYILALYKSYQKKFLTKYSN